jgi:hypothetical protein
MREYTKKERRLISKYRRLYRDRVHAGAKLLDKEQPGWESKISEEQLEMESPFQCILGQVFVNGTINGNIRKRNNGESGYYKGTQALDIEETDHKYGFTLDGAELGKLETLVGFIGVGLVWDWLAVYWLREVARRLA